MSKENEIKITKKGLELLKEDNKKFNDFYNKYIEFVKYFLNDRIFKELDTIKKIYSLTEKEVITPNDLKSLEQLTPKFNIFRKDGATYGATVSIGTEVQNFFEELNNNVNKVFEKYREKEEDDLDKKIEFFSNLQNKKKFMSIWSIYEIDKMNSKFSDNEVKSLTYNGLTIEINQIASWMDMWKYAEKLIRLSKDEHHIFIENFEEDKKNKGHFKLWTGS